MTRFGFNALVVVYLAPLLLLDIVGNTVNTGQTSNFYYYKSMFDGLLIAYAIWELLTDPGTTHVEHAKMRADDAQDTVMSFEKIGTFEYVYCAFLCLYAIGNWWTLHQFNSTATGMASIGSLIWSLVSIAVALLSAIQFYRLKSGALVELKHKVMA